MNFLGMLPWLEVATERALNSIPVGMAIAVVAWFLLKLLGKQNSGTRFALWFSTLLAVAGLPFLPGIDAHAATRITHTEIALPGSWAVAIVAGWMLFAIISMARIAIGLRHLRHLRLSSFPLDRSELPASLQATVQDLSRRRAVAICRSCMVQVPTAIGFFKPVVLLPDWALQDLSSDELTVILLHELAHVRRWDDWTNLLQKLVRVVFFFHPAVWWIEKRVSLEREMACDDAVLSQTENPRAYAECLVSLAEKSFLRRGLAMAQAILGHARDTSLRLAEILDNGRADRKPAFRPAILLVVFLATVSFALLQHSPAWIAFESPSVPQFSTVARVAPQPMTAIAKTVGPAVVPVVAASRRARAQEVLPVKHEQRPAPPVLVRTSLQHPVPLPQVLVFMQTTQVDGDGSEVVNLQVWQVTLIRADGSVNQETAIARKL